jgi:F0F1-type ATP synthase membrane subunit a
MTSSVKLVLAVVVMLVIHSAAVARADLATSLKHFLEAVRRLVPAMDGVGNGNNRVHHAAKILRPQPKSHLKTPYLGAQLG